MECRIDQLSEEQRDALRRFYARQETKEIARDLGISPSAVEQRFQRARAKLGTARTIDAARLLAEHDAACGRAPWGPSGLPKDDTENDAVPRQTGGGPNAVELSDDVVRREGDDAIGAARRNQWPFPARGRETNDLSHTSRVLWMIFGLVALLVTIALLMNSIVAFNAVFQPHV